MSIIFISKKYYWNRFSYNMIKDVKISCFENSLLYSLDHIEFRVI